MFYVDAYNKDDGTVCLVDLGTHKSYQYSSDEAFKLAEAEDIIGVNLKIRSIREIDDIEKYVRRLMASLRLAGKFPEGLDVYKQGSDIVLVANTNESLYGDELEVPKGVVTVSGVQGVSNTLRRLVLPPSVTSIGMNAFLMCCDLEEVQLNEGLVAINSYAFEYTAIKTLDLPSTVTTLGVRVFSGCDLLERITIHGNGKLLLQNEVFKDCRSLKEFNMPNAEVATWVTGLFMGCSSLEEIDIHPIFGVAIPESSFNGCTHLRRIIGDVKTISRNAFRYCESLEDFDFSSVTLLGDSSFLGCKGLKGDLVFNNYIGFIPYSCFKYCSGVRSIAFNGGCSSFKDNCFNMSNGVDTVSGSFASVSDSALEEIYVNGEVTSIGDSAFEGCESLKSIKFKEGVVSLLDKCFKNCSSIKSLKDISIRQVNALGHNAFEGCTALESVDIVVTQVLYGVSYGYNCFANCISLRDVKIKADMLSCSMFDGCYALESVDWTVYDDSCESCYIDEYAFYNCKSLRTVRLPKQLKSIKKKAFAGCSSLEVIEIPVTCEKIAKNAFDSCVNLRYLVCDNEDIVRQLVSEYPSIVNVVW